ncbi:MAG: TetR/AcrR family transcriptional regulator [Desulforhopalus sp.]|nr:TetR/AcrR family transcriptional regulator [Desulforhopalus sp.]
MTENDSGFFFSPETLEDLYNAALWGGRNDILLDYLHFRHLTGQLPDWLRRTAKGLQDQHGVENALPLNIDKKEAIVRAAIRIFIEKGCADTSIADIVAEAAIGRGTFYVFFKNKDEIFIDSAERLFFDLYADVWQEVKDDGTLCCDCANGPGAFL